MVEVVVVVVGGPGGAANYEFPDTLIGKRRSSTFVADALLTNFRKQALDRRNNNPHIYDPLDDNDMQ